jgi:hypothetical protein
MKDVSTYKRQRKCSSVSIDGLSMAVSSAEQPNSPSGLSVPRGTLMAVDNSRCGKPSEGAHRVMSIQVTKIKVSGPSTTHETITDYYFKDEAGTETGWKTKTQGVDYVDGHASTVWVGGGAMSAWVEVIPNPGGAPYLRTRADGVLSDNLLSVSVEK